MAEQGRSDDCQNVGMSDPFLRQKRGVVYFIFRA